jgi:DNA-binding HxlR family transcriptional regulator
MSNEPTGTRRSRIAQPGDAALSLLSPEWTTGIVVALECGPLRPADLKRRFPAAPHATVMDRLRALAHHDVIVRDRVADDMRATIYSLTDCGRDLGAIAVSAARLECASAHGNHSAAGNCRPAGETAIRLMAPVSRAIRRVLADGPLVLSELERRLPHEPHSSIRRRLHELQRSGQVEAWQGRADQSFYELVRESRRMALLGLLATGWEQRWTSQHAPLTGVGEVLHMIAPLVRIPSQREGVCRLHVECQCGEPDVHLAVGKGKIAALPLPPILGFNAVATASPAAWNHALLRGDLGGVAIAGDRALLADLVSALSDVLHA